MRPHEGHKCYKCEGIVGQWHEPSCPYMSSNRNTWRKSQALFKDGKHTEYCLAIITLFADGHSVKSAANALAMPVDKLQRHVNYLRNHYKTRSTTGLVAKALREGWIK